MLAAALADGVGILRDALGDDAATWRWGALHLSAPTHPLSGVHPEWEGRLDPPAVEMAGEWDTVFATSHAAGRGFAVTGASVARYVFDLADWDDGGWVVPLGASGECTSDALRRPARRLGRRRAPPDALLVAGRRGRRPPSITRLTS